MTTAENLWQEGPRSTRIIDLYVLKETGRPLGISLLVVLTALLIERVLRLLDILAVHGGPLDIVLRMALNLVPHYLGLALPAAFFISIFLVIGRLSDDNELDALQSSGLSISRVSRPFFWVAALLALAGVLLFGFVQPYSRYAYRAVFHNATHAAWNASVTENVFIDTGKGVVIAADSVDRSGQDLERVFMYEVRQGVQIVTTAARGSLWLREEDQQLYVRLEDGVQIRAEPDGRHATLTFNNVALRRDFAPDVMPFRPRGNNERELTLLELWAAQTRAQPPLPAGRLEAEFHSRWARAASILLLPLLAVPMGIAAKRGRRGHGIAIAGIILAVFHHLLQLGESLADVGRLNAVVGVWTPFGLFALLCLLAFRTTRRPAAESPFDRAFHLADVAVRSFMRWVRPKQERP